MPIAPADLPPVTDAHRRRAHALLAMRCNFSQAMADPIKARIVECCAAGLRTKDWEHDHKRTVVPVRRVRLGVDGHPVGWATQRVMSGFTPITQPELPI